MSRSTASLPVDADSVNFRGQISLVFEGKGDYLVSEEELSSKVLG